MSFLLAAGYFASDPRHSFIPAGGLSSSSAVTMKRRTEPTEVISPLTSKKKKFEELGLNLSSTSDDGAQCSNQATQGAAVADVTEKTKGKTGIQESSIPPKKEDRCIEDLETSAAVAEVAEKMKGKTGIQESKKPPKREDCCVEDLETSAEVADVTEKTGIQECKKPPVEDLETRNPEPTVSPATFVSDISIAPFNTPVSFYEVHELDRLYSSDEYYDDEGPEPTLSPATFVSDISIASFNTPVSDDDVEVQDLDRLYSSDEYYDDANLERTLSPATFVSDISIASFNTPVSDDDEEYHHEPHDYDGPRSSDEDNDDDYIFISTHW
ncbi:uncharacterized protein LOC144762234 isoform X1 [Lissotriton helveticus]